MHSSKFTERSGLFAFKNHTINIGLTLPIQGHISESSDSVGAVGTSQRPGDHQSFANYTNIQKFFRDPTDTIKEYMSLEFSHSSINLSTSFSEGKQTLRDPPGQTKSHQKGFCSTERRAMPRQMGPLMDEYRNQTGTHPECGGEPNSEIDKVASLARAKLMEAGLSSLGNATDFAEPEYERQVATGLEEGRAVNEGKAEITERVTAFLEERGGANDGSEDTCMESSDEDYERLMSRFDEIASGRHSKTFCSFIAQLRTRLVELIEARGRGIGKKRNGGIEEGKERRIKRTKNEKN
ncbi:hypothetical protein JCM33374_g6085 [Metschnikowia sp. JCM 33374]|nr:hypothetical protein JCM33374_g6085 [Metschnikowia sp. JCM 33374]